MGSELTAEQIDALEAEVWLAERGPTLAASADSDADYLAHRVATLRLMVEGLTEWSDELRAAWARARAWERIRGVDLGLEALLVLAARGVSDAELEEALAEAAAERQVPLTVEPDSYDVRLARFRLMAAGALERDDEYFMRKFRANIVCTYRGADLRGDDLLAFAALDDPAIDADYEAAEAAALARWQPEIDEARAKAEYARTIRELASRAVAAAGQPASIAASALPLVDPGVDEVMRVSATEMVVRHGDVLTVIEGEFA